MWMGDMQPIKATLAFTISVERPNGKSPSSSKFRERGCNSYKCGDWFSSEDEDWRAGGDDIPNVRHECQYICHVEENSDDGFSNYESGDEGVATSTDTNIDVDEESRVNREKKEEVYHA
ncbi:unnamed protein product [Ilex paraguariensis]|uniref:Uncharacterized protein n=1 Tax=Ilex paraguariensis TaxID=185542 RepID=A0ABC8UA33_9AQUA